MPFKDFQSVRLQMKPVKKSFAKQVWPILNDSRLYTYLPEDPPTLDTLERRFAFWEPGMSPDQSEYWLNWMIQAKDTQQVFGTIQAGIHRESKVATIAYILGSDFQKKGYATEAVSSLIDFLKKEYQVNQVKAWIDTRNIPSIRLVERLGLTRIELIEKADHFKGTDSDEFVYRLQIEYRNSIN